VDEPEPDGIGASLHPRVRCVNEFAAAFDRSFDTSSGADYHRLTSAAESPVAEIMKIFGYFCLLTVASSLCWVEGTPDQVLPAAKLVHLSAPTYPRVAQKAHITGDLVLNVKVRADGTVESATVDSGVALLSLRLAALDSANHSSFECQHCGEALENVRLVYSFKFELAAPDDPHGNCAVANASAGYPRITFEENHVTVVGQEIWTCDPTVQVARVRSIRCLYLWKCRSVPD